MMGLMTNPPKESDESYPQYSKERDDLLASLKRRAHLICNMLNTLEGVTCREPEGAMYAFPLIEVSTPFFFCLDGKSVMCTSHITLAAD